MSSLSPFANQAPRKGKHARILLVNDHEDARILLKRTLQRAGFHNITEASDGRLAVQQLHAQPIDLLITDVHMPHLDGWRLARMVRSGLFRCAADIPIIVISATFCERIAETTAKEFGVSRFLALKDRGLLVSTVEAYLCEEAEPLTKPTLLIVEDDPETARLAHRILQNRFDIDVAVDGKAGLALWHKRRHDLVLLDVMLPGMSGDQVLKNILRERPTQAVVIMTADGTAERSEKLMLEGAADFIAKPFQPEALRRVCEIAARREDYMVSNEQFAQRLRALQENKRAYQKIAEAYQRLLDNLSTVIFELDSRGRIRFLNQAWHRLTSHPIEKALHRPLCTFIDAEFQGQCALEIEKLLTGEIRRGELEVRFKGDALWVEIAMDSFHDAEDGKAIFGRMVDITERKRAQQELEYLAMHDPLTGVYNRRYFEATLAHLAALSARGEGTHALAYIDLDHFKVINDTLGHPIGDVILKRIAHLLASRLRKTDTLSRLGGDEFAALLYGVDKEQALAIAEELHRIIEAYQTDPPMDINCSIGLSLIDGSSPDPDQYLVQADIALYVAKKRGRNLIHFYDPRDKENEELQQCKEWARRVREAIENSRLALYLQPILHLETDRIDHYEALLRLHLPGEDAPVSPGRFIPPLEELGLVTLIDEWVIRHACLLLKAYPSVAHLSVNLSAHIFRDESLLPMVEKALSDTGVAADRLIFEITETASLIDMAQTQHTINKLHALGCHFALDDFGTGFSTFSYIKHLPAEYLKIDGTFIKDLDKDPINQALVRSINEIAHILGKKTVAEWVEDNATLKILKELGIDYAQGFHIAPPLPPEGQLER